MIGDDIINNANDSWISKVITLPNNRIASCSMDYTIKKWKSNPPTFIKVLIGHKDLITSLLYIKERDRMISGSSDMTLRLWDISEYQCDNMIESVDCCGSNSLY